MRELKAPAVKAVTRRIRAFFIFLLSALPLNIDTKSISPKGIKPSKTAPATTIFAAIRLTPEYILSSTGVCESPDIISGLALFPAPAPSLFASSTRFLAAIGSFIFPSALAAINRTSKLSSVSLVKSSATTGSIGSTSGTASSGVSDTSHISSVI